jgi:hypothetical protein
LRERRRQKTARSLLFYAAGAVVLAGLLWYGLWRPEVRIETVDASSAGADQGAIEALAKKELSGTFYGVIPRNSFFFYPERAIRADILDAYPRYSAVALNREGFSALAVTATPRAAAFRWCGTPDALSAEGASCYDADADGLVFEYADPAASSTGELLVYAKLEDTPHHDSYPIRAHVVGASSLPAILSFAHSIEALGVPLSSVAIEGDEASLFVAPNTRITYVIGHEATARKDAAAAFPTLNLQDGSIEYVDLRFDGKVYLRRRGE